MFLKKIKSWKALFEFGSEWREEDNMPLDILQKIANIFANADINNCIQEELHVESSEDQMELGLEDLYDNGDEQNKIKVDDCST